MASIVINKWERVQEMTREDIIRFQLLVYCHLGNIHITDKELECLTLVGIRGTTNLRELCPVLVHHKIYTSTESSRGALDRLADKKLLYKEGKNRKSITLEPSMKIQREGNIMLDIKCLARE